MPPSRSRRTALAEPVLYAALVALAALACAGPFVPQAPHYHAFADQRALAGLPHAADVLTNAPFLAFGLWGLARLVAWARGATAAGRPRACTAALAGLFFAGLLCTAVGSSLYHLDPQDPSLWADRIGMLPAFAGMAGLAVQSRIGERPAAVLLGVGGVLALHAWRTDGQLLPWIVVQGGGMALVLALAAWPALPGRPPLRLAAVIGWYALAKLLEWGDQAVWQATDGWVAGHGLKHLAAACAALPVLQALRIVDRPPDAVRRAEPSMAPEAR